MRIFSIATSVLLAVAPLAANAGAIRDQATFTTNTLPRNDDGSTGLVNLGFSINFYGSTRTAAYVNNNGNITFTGPLSTFTPFAITGGATPILAPFFADIDTRNAASGVTQYGTGTLGGRNVFGVNWIGVGYFPSAANLLNSIQLIVTDRSDIAAGDFDFEYNYDTINWETGGASGGSGGFGGSPARVGWTNGAGTFFELNGSGVTRAFLDSNATTGLINRSLNSNVNGRYVFNVRSGIVAPPPAVPESATWMMMIVGFGAVGGAMRIRSRKVTFA